MNNGSPIDVLTAAALVADSFGASVTADELRALAGDVKAVIAAGELIERMNNEALPKFDWARSALDANAIDLLNRAPMALTAALKPWKAAA